jgi:hypothetical protein
MANFIARGAGTSAKRGSSRGFIHALENTLKEDPPEVPRARLGVSRLSGRPDLVFEGVVKGVSGTFDKEFKNRAAGNLLGGNRYYGEIAQLWEIIREAKRRAGKGFSDAADERETGFRA